MSRENGVIGQPLDRVDGRLKVTGAARYSADMPAPNVAHAVMITSTIGSGHVRTKAQHRRRWQWVAGGVEIEWKVAAFA